MALTQVEKEQERAKFTSFESNNRTHINANKPELREVFDAVDGWVEENALAFNLSIPQPMRNSLTLKQKLRVLNHIINRRYLNE